jgi:hypothetical protein
MIERKSYICEHCNIYRPSKKRAYLSREKAAHHEKICLYNPEKKTCWTCLKNNYYSGINHCEHGYGKPVIEQFDMPLSERLTTNCPHWNEFDLKSEGDDGE